MENLWDEPAAANVRRGMTHALAHELMRVDGNNLVSGRKK